MSNMSKHLFPGWLGKVVEALGHGALLEEVHRWGTPLEVGFGVLRLITHLLFLYG